MTTGSTGFPRVNGSREWQLTIDQFLGDRLLFNGRGEALSRVLLNRTNGNASPHINHAQASRRASGLQQPQRLGHQRRQRRLSVLASQQPATPGHPYGASGQSLTVIPHQQQPTRATLNALRLLSRLSNGSQPGCQPKRDDQPQANHSPDRPCFRYSN